MSRRGYEVTIGARSVHLAELTVAEMLTANAAGGASNGSDASFAAKLAALRMSVREVDGKAMGFVDLQGKRWDALFSVGQTLGLMGVLDGLHSATADEVTEIAAAAVVTETADGSTTTVTLASGVAVTLAVLPSARFQAVLAFASKQQAALAQRYMTLLDGVRRSIVSIDGQAPVWAGEWLTAWPFTPKDTSILGSIWEELHGLTASEADRPTVAVSTK